jgi:hypothetical protein
LRLHRRWRRRRQTQAAGQLRPVGRGLGSDGRLGPFLLTRGGRRRRRRCRPRLARLRTSTQFAGQFTPMIGFSAFARHDLKAVWRLKRDT